ncbi:MAG: coproporphyrinogen III oxidase family protein [Desulfobacteraceae bacterium]|nr:coproporphyrinogen III oxidase family protein [Desulfobacteraceae bacterium]
MIDIDKLEKIKKNFFQGSLDYTKNQPDLFLPHKYQMVSPKTINNFIEDLRISIANDKRLLIYIHLPFCFSECVFCNSFPHKTNKLQQETYFKSVLKEIELFAQTGLFDGKEVQCIYFGGGTPTSFSNDNLGEIINKIKSYINIVDNASITTEAHPSTLENPDRIKGLSDIGINRVSIGCQTFDPEVLKICKRSHTKESIKKIIDTLNDLNMLNNIDMMTGLPGQTIENLKKDMEILEEIKPVAVEYLRHEIVNPLAVEIYKKNPNYLVKDEDLFKMVYMMQEWMQKHGYEQNGYFTEKKYWEYRHHWINQVPIIAFGSRARSYSKSMSWDKHEDTQIYTKLIEKDVLPIGRYIKLSKNDQMYRTLFLNLQTLKGLSLTEFKERFNENGLDVFENLLSDLKEFDLVKINDTSIRLTESGAFFVEDVCDFIIDFALKLESKDLKRNPNSLGTTSARL